MATDRGTPRLAGSATLTVIIVDLNDNSPMIPLPREIRVPEGKQPRESLFCDLIIKPRIMLLGSSHSGAKCLKNQTPFMKQVIASLSLFISCGLSQGFSEPDISS